MIPSATMARQRVYLQGQVEFDEHIRRLQNASPESKRAVLMGGAQVSDPSLPVQGMTDQPAPAPAMNTARLNQLTGGEYSNPNVSADPRVVAGQQEAAAAQANIPVQAAAADAAEVEAARVGQIAAAPQPGAAFAADPAAAGRSARLATLAGPASMNPIKAQEAETANLDFETATNAAGVRGGYDPERMTSIRKETAKSKLISETGGGVMKVARPGEADTFRSIGPGPGHDVVVPATEGGLDAAGNYVAGTPATTRFEKSGPDEVQQQKNQGRKNVLLAPQAQGAQSEAQAKLAALAPEAAQAGIAGQQADVALQQQQVAIGAVRVKALQAMKPEDAARALTGMSADDQDAAAMYAADMMEYEGKADDAAALRSIVWSRKSGRPVTISPQQYGLLTRAATYILGHRPGAAPVPPAPAPPPVVEPTRKR